MATYDESSEKVIQAISRLDELMEQLCMQCEEEKDKESINECARTICTVAESIGYLYKALSEKPA